MTYRTRTQRRGAALIAGTVAIVAIVLGGCGIQDVIGSGDDGDSTAPPPGAVPALQAMIYSAQLVVDSDADDPTMAVYPTGMTVTGDPTTEISISLSSSRLSTISDVRISGTVAMSETTSATEGTIHFSGTFTFENAGGYSSGSVDSAVTFPLSEGHSDTDEEPLSVSGTTSLGGASWSFSAALDAVTAYEEENGLDELVVPCRGVFFGVGPATDDWSSIRGGTIAFSPDGTTWGPMWLEDEITLTGVAADDAGVLVAVGADSFDWQPQGPGAIYRGTNGDTWTRVHTTADGEGLGSVTWSDGLWVATGSNGTLLTSSDGITWSDQSLTESDAIGASTTFVRCAVPGVATIVGMGETPVWSVIFGGTWLYKTAADLAAGTGSWVALTQTVDPAPGAFTALGYDLGTTEWIAAGSDGALYFWGGSSSTPDIVDSTNLNDAYVLPPGPAEGEVKGIDAYVFESTTYRFLTASYQEYGGAVYRSTVSGSTPTAWSQYQVQTSYSSVPPRVVVAGTVTDYADPRFLMLGPSEIWISDSYGQGWELAKSDWYGLNDVTYRTY